MIQNRISSTNKLKKDIKKVIRNYYKLSDKKLDKCINEIMHLFYNKDVLTIKIDSEIYNIPYNDINFIDKCKGEEWSLIHTKSSVYKCKNNLIYFEKILCNDIRFIKTHRSCIVNLNNIFKVNKDESIIYFDNEITTYLSRNHKKELLKYFNENTI